MTNKQMTEIFDAIDQNETKIVREAKEQVASEINARIKILEEFAAVIRKQFAENLMDKIAIRIIRTKLMVLSVSEIKVMIDEILKAK